MHYKRRLFLLLCIYIVLATSYSIVVPIGRGADEWAHYWYAQFIAQNGRLPANPAERESAGYKSDWPPLYHLFAAGVTGWIETEGPPTFKYRADTLPGTGNIRRQLVPAQGPEAILHTRDESFPWQQEILVWHVGRFLSIGFSIGTLAVTYFIALELFAGRKARAKRRQSAPYKLPAISPHTLALAAVAILAFNPRFLFTGMLFNYDSLTLLLASIFLWLAIRVVKGYYSRWGFWALGAVAGLALITKYLAAPLVVVIIVIAWRSAGVQGRRVAGAQKNVNTSLHSSLITHHSPRPTSRTSRFALLCGQGALTFVLITGWWFGYLFINFNEIDTYGPVLGTVAPFLRGDGSDRTVEELFTWLSGGQASPPDYIERQTYTAWQIIRQLPTTFWGNPVMRPYPLNWFIGLMSLITFLAALGLGLFWWGVKGNRFWINLLLLYCLLPAPFMAIRLFGARDALEAVQGRHILFLAGPAFAILLVLGWWSISHIAANILRVLPYILRVAPYFVRITLVVLPGLLLTGALAQLIFMHQTYRPLLPVKTTPPIAPTHNLPFSITLPGGAELIDYQIALTPPSHFSLLTPHSLQVSLIWQGGDSPAPEDYQTELALIDTQQQAQSSWLAYQTQARYPTRAWEAGDTIYDEGWLPLVNLPAGEYEVRFRLLAEDGPVVDWQTLDTFSLNEPPGQINGAWALWQDGQIAPVLPTFHERETAQFTIHNSQFTIHNFQLTGPDNTPRLPASLGPTWANFIIGPDWPAGDYTVSDANNRSPVLQVAPNERNFQMPNIETPLEVNFAGKIKLLGYHLPSRRVEPGNGLPIILYWQGLEWMGQEFVIFDRLLDNQQVAWGGYDRLTQENYSTLLWAPGQIIVDGFAVPVAADAPDGVYTLNLGWYREVNGQAESLPILSPETGQPTGLTSMMIGPIKVGGPPAGITVDHAFPQNTVNIPLGGKIELLGFDINGPSDESSRTLLSDSAPLKLTFYWQALTPMEINYTIFAHVRDAAGEIVAQQDQQPADGAYPTTLWDAGEIIRDELSIPLEGLEPGEYELVGGMYDLFTGTRLPIDGSADGTILLQTIKVSE